MRAFVSLFQDWYERTLTQLCRQDPLPREPHWSAAFAVGSRRWLSRLAGGDLRLEEHIRPLDGKSEAAREDTCVLNPPQSAFGRIWDSLVKGGYR
ncbi:MAG: hypothetical protein JXB13_11570 [Phycisphaerae bacterium]|nr:hypothetical protein [Phycisphaerae bacterium]